MCRLLIPPAAIAAIRAPETFAKIEITAAYKLKGHARRLYAALADKKRMGKPYWAFTLDELRRIFDCADKYPKWAKFAVHVLQPALDEINDYGTVSVRATPEKSGRSIVGVRFDWQWKTIDEARETSEENDKPAIARRKPDLPRDAPPLTDLEAVKTLKSPEDRQAFAAKVMSDAGFRK